MDSDKLKKLEDSLWEAADQLRANSNLGSTEYFLPVMGLIFLRHAYNRFLAVRVEIEKSRPKRGGVARPMSRDDFLKQNSLFLREPSQFEYLLNLPDNADKGAAINKAMDLIEKDYTGLRGVLPKEYQVFDNDLLTRLLKIFNAEALRQAGGDLFGRIYEYFLMKFAMLGAHDSGEFFTPVSLVQTIVNVIEPNHGVVFDPACGSGGMFVQTSHFIEGLGRRPSDVVTFYGQEKTATTIRLAKMNLSVHGLEGKIMEGNTFYQDHHDMLRKAHFVMANPPFNVDGVDADKVRADPRLPFGLPGVNKKGAVSSGNYLWISYFLSYLEAKGRAGFVMSSQASSAGRGEQEVRRKIVQSGAVDVMISIRPNFFYTRSVPCELWFFDRGKPKERKDRTLMLDARQIYRKLTRKIFDFTSEQLKNLTAIVWLYRGQNDRLVELLNEYYVEALKAAGKIAEHGKAFRAAHDALLESIRPAVKKLPADSAPVQVMKELTGVAARFSKDLSAKALATADWKNPPARSFKAQKQGEAKLSPMAESFRDLAKEGDHVYKLAARLVDSALETTGKGNGREWKNFQGELDEKRDGLVETLKNAAYFHRQIYWLVSRFPDGRYSDVPGLCKLVSAKDIEASDWSLTPGSYVGVAALVNDEDFDFEQILGEIHTELADLNQKAVSLANRIQKNFEALGL